MIGPITLKNYLFHLYLNIDYLSFNQWESHTDLKKRVYDAEDPNDVLHAGRSHVDRKLGLWIKKGIGEDLSLKLSTRLRSRETDSQYRWVRNLKSFHQLQFWLNIEWDLLYDKY